MSNPDFKEALERSLEIFYNSHVHMANERPGSNRIAIWAASFALSYAEKVALETAKKEDYEIFTCYKIAKELHNLMKELE